MFPKPPKRKKERRERKQERQEAYTLARISFFVRLAARQGGSVAICEVCGEAPATVAHHKAGRDGDKLADDTEFLGACDPCHTYIHAHPEESYELGYMVRRNG